MLEKSFCELASLVYSGLAAGDKDGLTDIIGVKLCVTVGEMDVEGVTDCVNEAVEIRDEEIDGLVELLGEIGGLTLLDTEVDVVGDPDMLLVREAVAVLELEGEVELDELGLLDSHDNDIDGLCLREGEIEGEVVSGIDTDDVNEGLVEVEGVGDVDGGIM